MSTDKTTGKDQNTGKAGPGSRPGARSGAGPGERTRASGEQGLDLEAARAGRSGRRGKRLAAFRRTGRKTASPSPATVSETPVSSETPASPLLPWRQVPAARHRATTALLRHAANPRYRGTLIAIYQCAPSIRSLSGLSLALRVEAAVSLHIRCCQYGRTSPCAQLRGKRGIRQ